MLSHETSYPLARTSDPLRLQFSMHARAAIHPSVGMVNGLNAFGELAIFSLVFTHRALPPGVVSTHRHAERLAEPIHWIRVPMVFDEREPYNWLREKMVTAFFNISRSCRIL